MSIDAGPGSEYRELTPVTNEEAMGDLSSRNSRAATEAVLRIALFEPDWQLAERVCLIALEDERGAVKTAALTSLGHIARRFRTLHLNVVLPLITELLASPTYGGAAEDALDDIAMFVKL
jgi:hypothetical protein